MAEIGRVESRRVYTGRVVNLEVDRVRFPDGSIGELEMVRHPGASAIVPFLTDPSSTDAQILLIRQYRYAANGFMYEIPAGRLDAGEEPIDCARRELAEETGCTAERIEYAFTMYTTPGFTDEKIHLFVASGLERGRMRHEADEFMEVEALSFARALSMIEAGEIRDAKTALGLLYTASFRGPPARS